MPPRPAPPECPRCGYDLSGAVAAWPEGSCPCEGRCSECGLEVLWRDVLNPVYAVNELFFETSRRHRVRAFLLTWWKSLRPWTLWRDTAMHLPLCVGRLSLFVLAAVFLLWLFGAGLMVGRSFMPGGIAAWTGLSGASLWTRILTSALWPATPAWWWWNGYRLCDFLPPWLAMGWLWLMLTPLMFRLVPQTLRRAKVRAWHIVRIWGYSLVGIPLLMFGPPIGDWAASVVPGLDTVFQRGFEHRGVMAICLLTLWSAWLIACWGAAAKHYLRLERPWQVAVVLVMLGGLVVVTLGIAAAASSPAVCSWMRVELS